MKLFVRFFMMSLLAVAAFAGDVNGKWKASYESPDGQKRESTFDFKADGAALTGTVASTRGESKIEEGKIEGDNITFKVTRNFNGQDFKISYKGKVEGDEIKLMMSFGEDRSFDMVAKREK